ncbi:hypothetical protein KC842_01430 [Candidatus Nomurabacteria bacterium]|nr:hypothetical protein [Candidatus Nomurabacteria bacterium]USN94474.1 MAG: hypothetical protein H6791_01760 [Candidatus Nomurabacteria bacterium]
MKNISSGKIIILSLSLILIFTILFWNKIKDAVDKKNIKEEIAIESMNLTVLDKTFPVQAYVVLSGITDNNCDKDYILEDERLENDIILNLYSVDRESGPCVRGEVPFREFFPVNLIGLTEGDYTIRIGEIEEKVTLEQDNFSTISDQDVAMTLYEVDTQDIYKRTIRNAISGDSSIIGSSPNCSGRYFVYSTTEGEAIRVVDVVAGSLVFEKEGNYNFYSSIDSRILILEDIENDESSVIILDPKETGFEEI